MNTNVTAIDEAVDYAIEFTQSPESRLFFLKAALRLSAGQLREAVDEIRMREHSERFPVKDRAKYVIWLLDEWMKEAGVDDLQRPSAQSVQRPLSQKPLVELRAVSVPSVLTPQTRLMPMPFSKRFIPWFRDLTNDFFTLTNDKAEWDEIATAFDSNGEKVSVTLIRGKLSPDDRTPMGIPTVEDMRVLIGSVKAWSDGTRGAYDAYETSTAKSITHVVEVKTICEILGISTGGKQIEDVTNVLLKLMRTGYYFKTPNDGGFSFRFIEDVTILDKKETGERRRQLRIKYSEPYSRQLIERNVVSRPPSILTIRGDIAFKLVVYLFPILKKKGEYFIELNELIDRIGLKRTGWSAKNGYKSLRKREFGKAVEEINKRMGEIFSCSIEQGLNKADFELISRLKNNP